MGDWEEHTMTRYKLTQRVAKLEAGGSNAKLSERAKAWLGLRPPLTAEEQAADPAIDLASVDRSAWSPELKAWLAQ